MDFPHAVIVAMALIVFPLLYMLMVFLDRWQHQHQKQERWAISPDTKYPEPTIEANDPDKKWYQP